MNKSVWLIMALGVGCMGLLWYFSAHILASPALQRFYLVRNTVSKEAGIPEDSMRLAHDAQNRIKGMRITLPDLKETDSLSLEELAGRVFSLEKEIRQRRREEARGRNPGGPPGGSGMTFFREIIFEDGKGLSLRLDRRAYERRKEIREAAGKGGRLRAVLGEMLEVKPDSIDLSFVEEGGGLSAAKVGVALRLEGKGKLEGDGLPEQAGKMAGIVYEKLAGKIHFFRFILSTGGGEKIYTARASKFFGENKAMRRTGKMRWERVFEAD